MLVKYDLESSLQYPAQLFEDQAPGGDTDSRLLRDGRSNARRAAKHASQLEALQGKIANYLEHQPPSPYRDAATQLQHRIEAARKGEATPVLPEEKNDAPGIAQVGHTAPRLSGPGVSGAQESVRPRRWLGKPVLMVFYNPKSTTAEELLRFAQLTTESYRDDVKVVGLAMSRGRRDGP